MIEQTVNIHDKYQAEIKFGYKLDNFDTKKSYDIAAYLFIPVSLGINASTYTKRDFFNDLLGYIRVQNATGSPPEPRSQRERPAGAAAVGNQRRGRAGRRQDGLRLRIPREDVLLHSQERAARSCPSPSAARRPPSISTNR